MRLLFAIVAAVMCATPALATTNQELRAALEQRFHGDRTGACVAAAVIDGVTATAYVCADSKSARPFDEHTAFEIGSVTKTMTAALLAEMIARREIALSDPIAKLLSPGTNVPSFQGRQITLADIVTHTSGLPSIPSQWHIADVNNPYAGITERDLIGALGATTLTRAPGSKWEYSNFAMMLLSYAIAKRSRKDLETLLRDRLFVPLGMLDTYIAKRPPQVRVAQGHFGNTLPAPPWDFPVDMAGVGGVRSTLPDMVRYIQAQLGEHDSAITPALARTQIQIADVDGHRMGINWILTSLNGRTILAHDGETGGFSSFIAFDRAAKRGVVILCDASLVAAGGFGSFGLHLLDSSVPPGEPRVAMPADPKLIDALVGRYRFQTGLGIELRHKGGALTAQADGQPEFEMGYDSAGDFYALQFDVLLRPKRKSDGSYSFTLFQGGGATQAERVSAPVAVRPKPTEAELKAYEGSYPLTPALALKVFVSNGKLLVQGTNQRPIEVVSVDRDVFVAESVGAEIDFERDASGKVIALRLKQGGQTLHGERR